MSEDYKVQASYKFGAYDQYMLNLRGDSVAEVEGLIAQVNVQVLTDLGATLKAADAAATGGLTTPTPPAASTPAPSAPPAPQPSGRVCTHGPRRRVTGNSARGAWVGWFCPLERGNPAQCKAEFE